MKIYNKIWKIVMLCLSAFCIVLNFISFGGVRYYRNIYQFIDGRASSAYTGYLYDNSTAGMIFLILAILVVVGATVIIILNNKQNKETKLLDYIVFGVAIIAGICGIVASLSSTDYIISRLDGQSSAGQIAVSYFSSNGEFVLDTVNYLSYVLIAGSAASIAFTFILSKKYPSTI